MGTTIFGQAQLDALTVHPHVRGDDFRCHVLRNGICGSPPRAWGRLKPYNDAAGTGRFTPTCVGTTCLVPASPPRKSVHPHVRGDDWRRNRTAGMRIGSPPRAWGRLLCRSIAIERRRFTPTCVGTTDDTVIRHTPPTVHPHVRGDDISFVLLAALAAGSPPRVWGRLAKAPFTRPEIRFTPTCVGTTRSPDCPRVGTPVHPHVRGDDATCRLNLRRYSGSPPRAWGRPVRYDPGGRGSGSPPRAWGRPGNSFAKIAKVRFTPTCVGTTSVFGICPSTSSVHPHVRGDDCGN